MTLSEKIALAESQMMLIIYAIKGTGNRPRLMELAAELIVWGEELYRLEELENALAYARTGTL